MNAAYSLLLHKGTGTWGQEDNVGPGQCRFYFGIAIFLPLILFLTGCATPELWSRTSYFPASPARIQISECENDVLVQYHERSTAWPRAHSRSFYVMQNADRLAARQPPIFVHGPPL